MNATAVPLRPASPPTTAAEADSGATLVLRLAIFAAFAAYGTSHWATLVARPSATTIAATVAAATACAVALAALDSSRLPRRSITALAAFTVLVALAAGLVASGVAPRLLLPSGWGEFADRLDQALLGVQGVDWPYDGPDEWIRLAILLGAPLLLTAAAALAFWPAPAEMRRPLRGAALVLMISLYAIAVTTNSPGSPLLFGALLLALIAAWLWLPRLGAREWAAGGAVVAAVTVLAMPAAAALDGDGPWLDYRSWSPFGADSGVAFSWDHSYGPLDWPRQGTTLLNVRSDQPHYWKAETLNSFDGFRWFRATGDEQRDLSAELPFDRGDVRANAAPWRYGRLNAEWNDQIQFTVRSLSTELLVGAGLTYDVSGAAAVPSADGTTQLLGTLARGDSYTVRTYQPSPTAIVMAGAPKGYPGWVERYTELALPTADADGDASTVVVPPRGNRASASKRADVEAALSGSVYSRVYELAIGLTAGSTSAYDAVAAVETHLREGYRYNEQVPEHVYPLESFLFEDRQGYCQQFSGAMALMLRMVGIPARVVAGFSPGTLNRKSGEYRVRDLDAHSWVEVYFSGIGWVTFDPTPRASDSASGGAPAALGASAAGDVSQSSIDSERAPSDAGARAEDSQVDAGAIGDAGESASSGGLPTSVVIVAAALAALALASALAFAIRVRRRNALDREQLAEAEIAELRKALERLGWQLSPATTLLALERQLGKTAGPRASAYAQALRRYRFDPQRSAPPGPADRRALRHALASASGPLGPLRALIALPPG